MNTRSGYVIDDTADLQSTRHLTQATSCRTIYEMPFFRLAIRTFDKSYLPSSERHSRFPALIYLTPPVGGSRLRGSSVRWSLVLPNREAG